MVDHSSSSGSTKKDLVDLPPWNFPQVTFWGLESETSQHRGWWLGFSFVPPAFETSADSFSSPTPLAVLPLEKSEGSLTSESRYWFHKASNFLPEKWFGFLKLKIIQVKRKIIWTIVSSICGFPNVNFPGARGDDGADFGAFERPGTLACWQVTKGVEQLICFLILRRFYLWKPFINLFISFVVVTIYQLPVLFVCTI